MMRITNSGRKEKKGAMHHTLLHTVSLSAEKVVQVNRALFCRSARDRLGCDRHRHSWVHRAAVGVYDKTIPPQSRHFLRSESPVRNRYHSPIEPPAESDDSRISPINENCISIHVPLHIKKASDRQPITGEYYTPATPRITGEYIPNIEEINLSSIIIIHL